MTLNITEFELPEPLPFKPSYEQAIFIEKGYNGNVNRYIQEHYDEISRCFNEQAIEFCYLPYYSKQQAADIAVYHNPSLTPEQVPEISFTTADFVDILFSGNPPEDLKPSIIVYLRYKSTPQIAKFQSLQFDEELIGKIEGRTLPFFKKLFYDSSKERPAAYLRIASESSHLHDPNSQVFYRSVNWRDKAMLESFKKQSKDLIVIDFLIHKLNEKGIDTLILKKMLCQMVDDLRPLSRLRITKDLRIILPDYNNLEISMEPVNKTVYLLFLNHGEGIRLKELVDHRKELEDLYSKVSGDDTECREATIDSLVDPTSNSINEKLSRIRQAFIARFDEDLAANYIITGKRGEPKLITLPRNMIERED